MMQNGRPLFQIQFPGPETPPTVRRSLARVDRNNPALRKLASACELLKLKPEVVYCLRDSWAHIGIPSKKIAIYMRQSTDTALFRRVKESWEQKGWKPLFITHRHAEQCSAEELASHLGAAIKEICGRNS